jgi:hypothetical protein
MGTVHYLLETKGRRGALEAGIERPIVEAAAAYLSDEDVGLSLLTVEVLSELTPASRARGVWGSEFAHAACSRLSTVTVRRRK